jgi:hypothetical protein
MCASTLIHAKINHIFINLAGKKYVACENTAFNHVPKIVLDILESKATFYYNLFDKYHKNNMFLFK